MTRAPLAAAALLLASAAAARDLFLRPGAFFVAPQARVSVEVLNGTFDRSEGSVPAARLADLSLAGASVRRAIPRGDWQQAGTRSVLRLRTGAAGTWVLGASTRPRTIALPADEFDAYLEQAGRADVRDARRARGDGDSSVTERYAKHVKALLQAGTVRDSGFARVLGYPAELVPLANPYALQPGDTLAVRCLVDGQPAAGQVVLAGVRGAARPPGARGATTGPERRLVADADGVVRLPLVAGVVYLRFVHLEGLDAPDAPDYASQWATLVFAVR